MDKIPPLRHPDDVPPVRTQHDLHQLWRMLMGPLGFSGRSLWLNLLAPGGQPTPVLLQIEDLPRLPTDLFLDRMEEIVHQLVSDEGEGSSVAFLLTGPGRGGITAEEQVWARCLDTAVRRTGVRTWPVHRANDRELRVCAPDDLAA
jgi:hypothetical protein